MNKRGHAVAIGKIELDKAKAIRFGELRASRFFQRRIVVGVHVVEPDNVAAIAQKTLCDMEADEAGSSGDENWAVSHLCYTAPASSRLEPPQINSLGLFRAIELCLHI